MAGFDPSKAGVVAASVVAALGALGIAGPLLVRMVRNMPLVMAALVVAALAVGAVSLWHETRNKQHRRVIVLGAVVSAGAVLLGAVSHGEREHPQLNLSFDDTASTLAVSASGSSLRSREYLGVDVRAVRLASVLRHAGVTQDPGEDAPFTSLHHACRDPSVMVGYPAPVPRAASVPGGTPLSALSDEQRKQVAVTQLAPPVSVDLRQLSWTEVGPDPDGLAKTDLRVLVPGSYDLVCVRAMLIVRQPRLCGWRWVDRLCDWTNASTRDHQSHGEMLIPEADQRRVPPAEPARSPG